jgi:hypothetical protein
VRSGCDLADYRWGIERKREFIKKEAMELRRSLLGGSGSHAG